MDNKNQSIIERLNLLIIKGQDICELQSNYNKNLIQIIKSIPQSRYDSSSKSWFFKLEFLDALIKRLTESGIQYELIEDLTQKHDKSIIKKVNLLIFKRVNIGELQSKYDKNVIEIMKSIPKSRFDLISKRWMFNLEYLDTLIKKLTDSGFEYDLFEDDAQKNECNESFVSLNFKEKSFLVNIPIPEKLKIKFWNTPKIRNYAINQWEFSDEYFMEFYLSCLRDNIVIKIQ